MCPSTRSTRRDAHSWIAPAARDCANALKQFSVSERPARHADLARAAGLQPPPKLALFTRSFARRGARAIVQDDAAGFKDVAVMRNFQRQIGVLFDRKNGDA